MAEKITNRLCTRRARGTRSRRKRLNKMTSNTTGVITGKTVVIVCLSSGNKNDGHTVPRCFVVNKYSV